MCRSGRFRCSREASGRRKIGEHWYRTETYTTVEDGKPVTHTRTVHGDRMVGIWPGSITIITAATWFPAAVDCRKDYAERIKPFRLEALKRYQPYFLAGWLSEEYSVERDAALAIVRSRNFTGGSSRTWKTFCPATRTRKWPLIADFSDINSDLILLPVYLLSYRYGDKLFRFLLNGQTGKDGRRQAVFVDADRRGNCDGDCGDFDCLATICMAAVIFTTRDSRATIQRSCPTY